MKNQYFIINYKQIKIGMGSQSMQSQYSQDIFRQAQWESQGKIGNTVILFNKQNPNQKIEERMISISDSNEYALAQKLFQLRKNDPHFVATKYSSILKQHALCSKSYHGHLYTQMIPLKLSNITHIPFPDVLHVYNQAFNGYHRLIRQVGPCKIDQQCIGVNAEHVVKVWHSPNFEQILPSYRLDSEPTMVRNIVSIIEGNTDQSTMPKQQKFFSNFLYRQSMNMNFDLAKRKLEQYAIYFNRGVIPNFLRCVAQAGGAENIKSRYIDSENSSGYQRSFHPPEGQLSGQNHLISKLNNEYRASLNSQYSSAFQGSEKRRNTLHNTTLENSVKIFSETNVSSQYNPATYLRQTQPIERPSSNIVSNTPFQKKQAKEQRILTPQNIPHQQYNASYLSPPPHSTYTANIQINQKFIKTNSHHNNITFINNSKERVNTLSIPQGQYQNEGNNNLSNSCIVKNFNFIPYKMNQMDHSRKKSLLNDQDDNLAMNLTNSCYTTNKKGINNFERKNEAGKNVITFNNKNIEYPRNTVQSNALVNAPFRKVSKEFQTQQIQNNLIKHDINQKNFLNFETKNKNNNISYPSQGIRNEVQNTHQNKNYQTKLKSIFNPTKTYKPPPSFIINSVRPKSQADESLQIKSNSSALQRTSLVEGSAIQRIQPVKVVQQNIIQSKKTVNIIGKREKKQQFQIQYFNKSDKIESSEHSSVKNVLNTDRNSHSSKYSEKKEQNFFEQQEKEWNSHQPNMKKQKNVENTPIFGSINSNQVTSVSSRTPQLSFNRLEQIIINNNSYGRPTFSDPRNQAPSFPRNTFQTANFTTQNNSNNLPIQIEQNQSIFRPTATYNRFSDEIDDENDNDTDAPKFGQNSGQFKYATAPITGYDYGVSKNYHFLNSDENIESSDGVASPQYDSEFEKNYEKTAFEEHYQTPIPPPVYQDHNFFDIKHNQTSQEEEKSEQDKMQEKFSRKNITYSNSKMSGSKTKLASPDEQFLYQYKNPEFLFDGGQRPSHHPSLQHQNYYRQSVQQNSEESAETIDKYRSSVNAYNCYEQNNFFSVQRNQTDFVPKYEYNGQNQQRPSLQENQSNNQNKQPVGLKEFTADNHEYRGYNMAAYDYGTNMSNPLPGSRQISQSKLQMNGEQIKNIPFVPDEYSLEWDSEILADLQNYKK